MIHPWVMSVTVETVPIGAGLNLRAEVRSVGMLGACQAKE